MYFQEFESHGPSEVRQKIDVQLIGTMLSRHIEDHENRNSQKDADPLKCQSQCDLRKSLAWDNAFFTSPGILDPEEMLETLNFLTMDNRREIEMNKKQRSITFADQEKVSATGDCSMRKSLAWDSAFFTSAGILDAEELSVINRGFKKSEAHMLPGTEDVRRSVKSHSTMNSDCYSLESLEIDLFVDVRASMCNSSKSSSNKTASNSKLRRSINLCGLRSSMPDASSRIRAGDGQLKETATGRESKFSLKPPKIILGSKNPPRRAPKKMTSPVGTKYVEIENDATVTTSRTPWKRIAGNNYKLLKSVDSSLMTTPKSSSRTSPASSNDEWSSESSPKPLELRSSNSAAGRVTSSRQISLDSDASQASNCLGYHRDRPCLGHENQETLTNSVINKSTVGNSPVLVSLSRTDRVSGLRIPSPKIGFFEDNPAGIAPNGCTPPKVTSDNADTNGAANKSRCSKRSLVRTSAGIPSKTGVKDEIRACLRGKPLKKREDAIVPDYENNAHGLDEANKENVANLENQVKVLSKSIKAIDFSADLFRELKEN